MRQICFFDLFLWLVTFQPSHHVTPSQDASKQILFGIHADAPAGIGAVAEDRNVTKLEGPVATFDDRHRGPEYQPVPC